MTDNTNKTFSISEWSLNHSIGLIVLILSSFCLIMTVVFYDKVIESMNDFSRFGKMIQENEEFTYQIRQDLRYSNDCTELQHAISRNLSFGGNPDSWFPSKDDKALKIGEQRYEILGCKP